MAMRCQNERTAVTRDIVGMRGMLAELALPDGERTVPEARDGWCRPAGSNGFRFDYDINIARGGWEYHEVGGGLTVILTDMVARAPTPRRHHMPDHVVMSIVVEGAIPLAGPQPGETCDTMSRGFCTLYGLDESEWLETVYPAGEHLRWLTVLIERDRFSEVTGIDTAELPQALRDFVEGLSVLPPRNVPAVSQALMTAAQMMSCPFDGTMRTAYLRSKALELT
jgi:hypothetical protein